MAAKESPVKSGLSAKGPYHHGDLKEALIKATLELVDAGGPRSFSLAQVCRQAGVSTAAPYRHFEDKESLLAYASQASFLLFRQALLEARAGSRQDPRQALRALAGTYIDFARHNQSRFRVMFSAGLPRSRFPDVYGDSRQAFDIVLETVAECQALLPDQCRRLDPYMLSAALWSQCHGLAVLLLDGYIKDTAVEERIPELLDLLIDRFIGDLSESI